MTKTITLNELSKMMGMDQQLIKSKTKDTQRMSNNSNSSSHDAWVNTLHLIDQVRSEVVALQPNSKIDTAAKVKHNIRANVDAAKQALQSIHNQTGPVVSPESMKAVQSRLLTIDKCLSVILDEANQLAAVKTELTEEDYKRISALKGDYNRVKKLNKIKLPSIASETKGFLDMSKPLAELPDEMVGELGGMTITPFNHLDYQTYTYDYVPDPSLKPYQVNSDDRLCGGCEDEACDFCASECPVDEQEANGCTCGPGDGCSECGGYNDGEGDWRPVRPEPDVRPKTLENVGQDLAETVLAFKRRTK